MRLVLSDYLGEMKEDGELDSFLMGLLFSMRYIPIAKIQRGRQYGVDIPAVGTDEDGKRKLFLFVVKRGNFSRKNWDNGHENDIRPSINEILDVYLSTRVPKPYDRLPVKIIVCCNGDFEPAVQENWAQFVNKNTIEGIEFDFWGLHKLVDYADRYQMNEEMLSQDLLLNFRRALSFLDLPDYNLAHLYRFLNELLPQKEPRPLVDKQVQKKLRLVNLCMSIIHAWCKKNNNLKPSYIASERIVLAAFNWIKGNDLIDSKNVLPLFYAILQNWRNHNFDYINNTGEYFNVPNGLGRGISDHNEYCLITYEQIGIVSTMGLYELWECSLALAQNDDKAADYSYKNAEGFANILARLIESNPASLHPRYDEHCIEINLALVLLYETGLFGPARTWLRNIIDRLILNVSIANFFPIFNSDPEKVGIEKATDQQSSLLSNFLAEWCLVLRDLGYYRSLLDFLRKKMPQLNLQLWIPDQEVEAYLYCDEASRKAGSTMISINLPDDHLQLEMHIAEERALMNDEKNFIYNKYGLSFLPFLASRHFRTYPFPNSWREYLRTNFCFNSVIEDS